MNKQTYEHNHESHSLVENEVHIWVINLDLITQESGENLNKILSEDETKRAAKFRFDEDSERFIYGTGILRLLINIYTDISFSTISFEYNDYGKPQILKAQNKSKLHFNMSNSENMLCIGFIKNESIGVDIEVIKRISNHAEIANNFFSNFEIQQLKSFPQDKSLDGFYTCWTGKEAFIKLSGEGLSYPLKEFDVQIKELRTDEIYRYKIQVKKNEENFFVEAFKFQDELIGACALKNESFKTTYWFFDESACSINRFINKKFG